MSNNQSAQVFEPVTNLVVLPLSPSSEPSAEGDASVVGSDATSYNPTQAQFTKAIAEHYGVTRKSVQEWVAKIKEACPWFADADLKLPCGQHSPLMVGLINDFRSSGLPLLAWKDKVWAENPELAEAWQSQQVQPSQQPLAREIASYQRPQSVEDLFHDRGKLAQIDHSNPDDNPVILVLRERLTSRQRQNQTTQAKLQNFAQASSDTELTRCATYIL